MRTRLSIIAFAFCLLLLAVPLASHGGPPDHAGPGAGQPGPPGQRGAPRGADPTIDKGHRPVDEYRESGRFTDQERAIIREWTGDRDEGGLTGRGAARLQTPGLSGGQRSLPPGLKMRLERGADLPPGWQQKVERGEVIDSELIREAPVSEELVSRLPRQPPDTRLIELEDQVVRVREATGLVLDVLDILRE